MQSSENCSGELWASPALPSIHMIYNQVRSRLQCVHEDHYVNSKAWPRPGMMWFEAWSARGQVLYIIEMLVQSCEKSDWYSISPELNIQWQVLVISAG